VALIPYFRSSVFPCIRYNRPLGRLTCVGAALTALPTELQRGGASREQRHETRQNVRPIGNPLVGGADQAKFLPHLQLEGWAGPTCTQGRCASLRDAPTAHPCPPAGLSGPRQTQQVGQEKRLTDQRPQHGTRRCMVLYFCISVFPWLFCISSPSAAGRLAGSIQPPGRPRPRTRRRRERAAPCR
jgi:hypothetical protein